MAAAPPSQFSILLADATKWTHFNADHATLLATVGGGSVSDRAACLTGLLNTSAHTPVVLAFVISGDEDYIHVGHTLTTFPAVLGSATPFDNLPVVLVGDTADTATPVALTADAFGRCADTNCHTNTGITGAAGHNAGPPVYRTGPHPAGTPDTGNLRARRVFLMEPSTAHLALSTNPNGRYTLLQFYNNFVRPGLADPDPAVQAATEPIRDWFLCASTVNIGDECIIRSRKLSLSVGC